MDSNFSIKPRPAARRSYTRDPVPVRETMETELDPTRSVAATGEGGGQHRHERHDNERHDAQQHDHAPLDVVATPESREVIYRENDVRAQAAEREHPDQALLRQRAYRPASGPGDAPANPEPHANIKA